MQGSAPLNLSALQLGRGTCLFSDDRPLKPSNSRFRRQTASVACSGEIRLPPKCSTYSGYWVSSPQFAGTVEVLATRWSQWLTSCLGDLSHLFSILILLHKMKTSSVRLLPSAAMRLP
jgi:hypothetical protein